MKAVFEKEQMNASVHKRMARMLRAEAKRNKLSLASLIEAFGENYFQLPKTLQNRIIAMAPKKRAGRPL